MIFFKYDTIFGLKPIHVGSGYKLLTIQIQAAAKSFRSLFVTLTGKVFEIK